MDSIIVAPPPVRLPLAPPQPPPTGDTAELLRQLVELQREQLGLLRQQSANQDERAKWKAFYGRFADDFPDLPAGCKAALPAVERAYLSVMSELTERLGGDAADDLGNEYTQQEILDRYAPKLMQLGNLLGQVGHLANLAPPPEPA
jgi:hypothetical protein